MIKLIFDRINWSPKIRKKHIDRAEVQEWFMERLNKEDVFEIKLEINGEYYLWNQYSMMDIMEEWDRYNSLTIGHSEFKPIKNTK